MAQAGTTPIAAPIDTTAIGDTYATHFEQRGQGGFRTVADITERDAISVGRRKSGMLVYCIADTVTYQLAANLTTWNPYSVASILPPDVMLKTVYDPNDDGIVTNSDALQGSNLATVLARANHTGTQAQSTIVNLVSDLALKEDIALIGTNGHAAGPLVGGLIPLAQLPIAVAPLYQGLYNATTNVPAIVNGVGVAGQFYIASVIGNAYAPVNVTIVNQIVAYDGAIWQVGAVFSGGIASLTTNLGVQTGPAVTLNNTSYLVDSAGKRFVTDNIQAGLNASPNPVTAANPVATQADLTSLIVVGNGVFMPELFSNGHTLGDGTLRRLNTLTNPVTGVAYTNVSAGNVWTRVNSAYTINVATMSIDWICWQEAYLAMKQDGYSKIISPGGRGYCPNQQLDLPLDQLGVTFNRRGLEFIFDGQGSTFSNLTGTDFIIMSRYFTNESQISGVNSYLLDYDYHFLNWTASGNAGNSLADGFVRLGATTHSVFKNIKTGNFGCPLNIEFALELILENIKHGGYGLYGTKITSGTWTGGNAATSGVNLVKCTQHRCVNGSGKTPVAGIYSGGGGNLDFDTLSFEGFNGAVHHFLSETPGAGAAESAVTLRNLYFETAGASRAAIKFVANKGDFFVDKWNNLVSLADTPVFIEAAHKSPPPQGVRPLFIRVSNAATNITKPKFRAVTQQALGYGHKWNVQYVDMPNKAILNDPANWDTSVANSYLPDNSQVIDYIPTPL